MFLCLIQFFFLNGVYLFLGFVLLFTILYFVQIPLKPSIFTIILVYHFLQIMSGVWLSNFLEKDINYRSEFLGTATLFSYIGVLFLFLPVIYFQNKLKYIPFTKLKEQCDKLSIVKTFQLFVIFFFISNLLSAIAFSNLGLTQIIVSFRNFKWFLFCLFGIQVFFKNKMKYHFYVVIIIEFSLGFFSIFSDFKTVLFFSSFIYLFFLIKINIKQLFLTLIFLSLLFYLGVKWTSVKGEYRSYLNKGSNTQTVQVGKEDAFNKLLELSGSETDFNISAALFFDRLQYTYHLAKTMERIPSVLPYENGGNIGAIISYCTTPRILNPDKAIYQASIKATKYTGISYLGYDSGVSVSLGYFADCFIDFGYYGMMFPLLILGFIYGYTYYNFINNSEVNIIINYSLVVAIYMEVSSFEADGSFLIGRLLSNLLVFYLVKLFVLPWLDSYLKVSDNPTKKIT